MFRLWMYFDISSLQVRCMKHMCWTLQLLTYRILQIIIVSTIESIEFCWWKNHIVIFSCWYTCFVKLLCWVSFLLCGNLGNDFLFLREETISIFSRHLGCVLMNVIISEGYLFDAFQIIWSRQWTPVLLLWNQREFSHFKVFIKNSKLVTFFIILCQTIELRIFFRTIPNCQDRESVNWGLSYTASQMWKGEKYFHWWSSFTASILLNSILWI